MFHDKRHAQRGIKPIHRNANFSNVTRYTHSKRGYPMCKNRTRRTNAKNYFANASHAFPNYSVPFFEIAKISDAVTGDDMPTYEDLTDAWISDSGWVGRVQLNGEQ